MPSLRSGLLLVGWVASVSTLAVAPPAMAGVSATLGVYPNCAAMAVKNDAAKTCDPLSTLPEPEPAPTGACGPVADGTSTGQAGGTSALRWGAPQPGGGTSPLVKGPTVYRPAKPATAALPCKPASGRP